MAAKYTTVLAALVAVLSGGTRRKPEYIRQQALVSLLYPYFIKQEVIQLNNSIHGFDVIYVKPPTEKTINENINVVNSIESISLKSIVTTLTVDEELILNNTIHAVFAKEIVKKVINTENIEVGSSIYVIEAKAVGLFHADTENLSLNNSVYQITVG